MSKYDYIVIDGSKQPSELWCKHCNERQVIPLPMPFDMYVALSKAFIKIHKRCLNRKENK